MKRGVNGAAPLPSRTVGALNAFDGGSRHRDTTIRPAIQPPVLFRRTHSSRSLVTIGNGHTACTEIGSREPRPSTVAQKRLHIPASHQLAENRPSTRGFHGTRSCKPRTEKYR